MSELKNHYQKIMKEIKENIKDEKDQEFILNKFQELSMMFIDLIDRLEEVKEESIKELQDGQDKMQDKILKLQKRLEEIENDIYADDDEFEFEIVCPYCNHEFVTEISDNSNADIECPECHNMIELDWNESNCGHECGNCAVDCTEKENKDDDM